MIKQPYKMETPGEISLKVHSRKDPDVNFSLGMIKTIIMPQTTP